MSINFLGPIFPTSPPSLKAISLVTSAWINSSPSCPHILLILRPCRPPSRVAQIPRQPPPCGPPPPPAPPDPMSPHPQPPPPLPHSPSVPVPPPDTSSAPIFHSVTTTFPSFPHIEVPVPDPTPRSRTPRRDTDPLFPTLIPDSHPPWVQQPGVTPVGAPGTTPLRPPGIAADPTSAPSLSMDHMDIRDYPPPDPDIAKGKVKAKVNLLTKVKARAKKDKVKDWAKEKANLKAKKNAPPPLLPLYMPQQPKGKVRNNPTTQPPLLLPFQRPGLSLWQVPPHFLSIISPPSAHPHGPACHCGRSRLATNIPNPLPSHLYTQPSVIPTFKARLVIVAAPAFSVSSHSFLSITPISLLFLLPFPQAHNTACYYCKSYSSTSFPPHPPHRHTYLPHTFGPGLSLWQVPPDPPSLLDSLFNTLSLLWPGLPLWQVPPPRSPLLTTSPLSITLICYSLLKARLVNVAGLACFSSSTPLITLFPSPLFLSLSFLAALRAPAAMGDPK